MEPDGRRRRRATVGETPTGSIVDEIYFRLSEEILDGHLHPGKPLVVASISDRMGVSAVPIREALRRLEGEHLVIFENNRGARVTDISLEDLADIYQARRVAEAGAVAAASKAGSVDIDRLKKTFDHMAEAYYAGRQKDAYRWHGQFHECLIVTGTSPRLERFVMTLLAASRRYLRLAPGIPTEAETLVQLHRAILEAVIEGDLGGSVTRAIHEHTDYSLAHLEHRRIRAPR